MKRVSSFWRSLGSWWRKDILWHLCALITPFVLAAWLTYPVIAEFNSRLVGTAGDNIAYLWVIHKLAQAVAQGKDFFFEPQHYYPAGYDVTAIESIFASALMALPVTLTSGPVAGYNLVVFSSFVLTSYGTFLWTRTMTQSNLVALLSGLASAFFPYRLTYLHGQIPQLATQWIPFCLWAVERYTRSEQLKWVVGIGVFAGLCALSSWYTMVFMLIALPLYVLFRRSRRNSLLGRRHQWGHLTFAAIIAGAMTLPVALPYFRAGQSATRQHPLWQVRYWSINPAQFFAQSAYHPLWGFAVQSWPTTLMTERPPSRPPAMLGWVMVAAATAGLLFARRRRLVRTLGVLGLAGVIGAAGPVLVYYKGGVVTVPASPSVMQALESAGLLRVVSDWFGPELAARMQNEQSLIVPLPYALIYRLPPFSFIRFSSRYIILAHFALCGLAALGTDAALRAAIGRRKSGPGRVRLYRALAITAVLLVWMAVLVEFWRKPYPTVSLRVRAVDTWLARQPRGVVVELPLTRQAQRFNVYAQLNHHHPLALGIGGSFPPPIHAERLAVLEKLPDPQAARALCAWGTRYVLVDLNARPYGAGDRWAAAMSALPIPYETALFESTRVYILTGCSEAQSVTGQ